MAYGSTQHSLERKDNRGILLEVAGRLWESMPEPFAREASIWSVEQCTDDANYSPIRLFYSIASSRKLRDQGNSEFFETLTVIQKPYLAGLSSHHCEGEWMHSDTLLSFHTGAPTRAALWTWICEPEIPCWWFTISRVIWRRIKSSNHQTNITC